MTVTTTGEVFTRRWVVDLMLDLAGYTGDVSALRVRGPDGETTRDEWGALGINVRRAARLRPARRACHDLPKTRHIDSDQRRMPNGR